MGAGGVRYPPSTITVGGGGVRGVRAAKSLLPLFLGPQQGTTSMLLPLPQTTFIHSGGGRAYKPLAPFAGASVAALTLRP